MAGQSKGKKVGKGHSPSDAAYKSQNRTLVNKLKKVRRHIKNNPGDAQSTERLSTNFKKIEINYKKI